MAEHSRPEALDPKPQTLNLPAVFLREIIQRLADHEAVVFLQQLSVNLAPEHPPAFVFERVGRADGMSAAIPALSTILLPASILVFVESFPDLLVRHDLPSRSHGYGAASGKRPAFVRLSPTARSISGFYNLRQAPQKK